MTVLPTGDWPHLDDEHSLRLVRRALEHATALGAEHVEARIMRSRIRHIRTSDGRVESAARHEDAGLGVRVLVDGAWGFAGAGLTLVGDGSALAARAVSLARASRRMSLRAVRLAPEPVHHGHWESPVEIDPLLVDDRDVITLLLDREHRLLANDAVAHADSDLALVEERTLLATSAGTLVSQRRTRVQCQVTALGEHNAVVDEVRTLVPPTARGWEAIAAASWDDELEQLPEHLAEKLRAPSVRPGRATLVIDPSNLWLTIHESVGHATELDRALGYEANYAGTSFASPADVGTLQYGSPLMHVTGDRTAEHGLATVAWDDEGVAGQQWDLVRDGVLVGFQLDRAMAGEFGHPRSNGCAYADSALHVPIQRMPNVSLQPGAQDRSTTDLIAAVEDGFYIVGDRSWSIDMQRYNFQFTGQRFYRIKSGRLIGQVRDLAYQSRTPDFWGSMVAIGGRQTYELGGALNCGKAQPGQVAAVSHGCPSAVFENVTVLNTSEQA